LTSLTKSCLGFEKSNWSQPFLILVHIWTLHGMLKSLVI
jgi:hypothetical protein